jgi:hypothetical protein
MEEKFSCGPGPKASGRLSAHHTERPRSSDQVSLPILGRPGVPTSALSRMVESMAKGGMPNSTIGRTVARLSNGPSQALIPGVNLKHVFDIAEKEIPIQQVHPALKTKLKVKAKGSFEVMEADDHGKGVSSKFTIGASTDTTHGLEKGVKGEVLLDSGKIENLLAGLDLKYKLTTGMTFNGKKLEVSVDANGRLIHPDHKAVQGELIGKFIFAGAEWGKLGYDEVEENGKKIEKSRDPNSSSMKVLAGEITGGFVGELELPATTGKVFKINVNAGLSLSCEPNWVYLVEKALEEDLAATGTAGAEGAGVAAAEGAGVAAAEGAGVAAAEGAGVAAAEGAGVAAAEGAGLAIEGASVASLAPIAAPAAFAALGIAGALQTSKNVTASLAGQGPGKAMGKQARTYSAQYARAITGGSVEGHGGLVGYMKLKEYMSSSKKTRVAAGQAFSDKNGGYDAIYKNVLTALHEKIAAESGIEFDRLHAHQFGLLEELGETWGMRGVFRREFYQYMTQQ